MLVKEEVPVGVVDKFPRCKPIKSQQWIAVED